MRQTILSLFLLSICLAAAPAAAGVNFWSPIGPDGGTITTLTASPRNSSLLYAATMGGVFRSADGGDHWVRASRGLARNDVVALAVAPANPSLLYASTGFDVFVSRNGGDTWSPVTAQLDIGYVLSLAVDPRNSRWVWAGTEDGPFWSHDGGAHWHPASADFIAWVFDLVIDPVHPDTLYVASVADQDFGETGIAKTTDGGKTWKRRNRGLEDVDVEFLLDDVRTRLAVDPTAPNVVYGCFVLHPDDPDQPWPIIAYRSTDGAATWQATEGGFPLAVDRRGVVYAGDRRSTDHGATWQPIATPPDSSMHYLAGDGALWAGTNLSGVFRSGDGGATWQPASNGLHATPVSSVAINPEQPGVLYAGVSGLGVRKTVNAGLSWQPADAGLPAEAFFSNHLVLAPDPQQPETVYLAWQQFSTGGFARSDDGGEHWTLLSDSRSGASSLVVDPTAPGALYLTDVGTYDKPCGLARSDDRGLTRRCLLPTPGRLVLDPVTPGMLWMLDASSLRKSTDRGESWTQIHPQGLDHAGVLRSLLIDPVHPGVLYLGTESHLFDDLSQRIWRSNDGGLHWRAWGGGMPETSDVTDLLIDPQQPSILYAAVAQLYVPPDRNPDRSGVYWSRDGGRTFTLLRDGLPGVVQQLILDPKNPRLLYAATPNDGIYTFTRAGR
ncbi:MAG TPA: hypothetical protein VIA62_22395 [Thermoanaerobaculia bacterium]|jgi:photosystem II stability/assembly factor-like uncharacterized protein|nr:hypothetical protein [Thermoanaerobaculia bacterium]